MDRAGHDYWAEGWKNAPVPACHDLEKPSSKNRIDRAYFDVLKKIFPPGPALSVIELGCGNSIWLVYFSRYFGAAVAGLDYTDSGCETARAIASHYKIAADIVKGDLFAPPDGMRGRYDVVYTNGVVEHFEDTADCIQHCAAFAKKGGHVVTFIPNLAGWIGRAQKIADRAVYDIHVPLDLDDLKRAHEKAGLTVVDSGYLMPLNLYMMNIARLKDKPWYIGVRAILGLLTRSVWGLERLGLKLPRNRALSSYAYVIAWRGQG